MKQITPPSHTPGPWYYGGPVEWESVVRFPSVGDPCWEIGPPPEGRAHPPMSGDGIAIARHEADARLIAAAPDLLAACKEWLDLAERRFMPCDAYAESPVVRLRAAIARATGGAS